MSSKRQNQFCSLCGSPTKTLIPLGDNRPRAVCQACDTIHYENPKMVVGCVPVWQDKVLLCKRAIEPRAGYWTLPAGFMENGETLTEAAIRETVEESGASVRIDELFTVVSLPHIHQVYFLYLATMLNDQFEAGEESLDVRLFSESEIPWEELAFPTVSFTLKRFFEDRRKGQFSLHSKDIYRQPFPRESTD